MEKIEISIIIPIHKYDMNLIKSLESAINQNFSLCYEIICVLDNTNNITYEKVKEYQIKYPNLIKIYVVNYHDPGETRNYGINKSIGEYIYFLDSDDFILPNTLTLLYAKAKTFNSDIVIGNHYLYFPKKGKKKSNQAFKLLSEGLIEKNKIITKALKDLNIRGFVWNKLFKASLIKDNNLKFLDTNYTIEDRPFLLECIILANKVYISKDLTYFYVQHNSSFVKSSNKLGFMQKSLNADFICKLILLKYNMYEDIKYKKLLVYRRTSLINDAKKIQKTLNIKYNLLVNQIERQLRLITNDLLYVYNTPWEKVVLNMNLEFSDKYKRLAKSTLVKDLRNYQ